MVIQSNNIHIRMNNPLIVPSKWTYPDFILIIL